MTFKPNYIPKERKKANYKIVVPFIVILAVLTYIVLDRYMLTSKENKNQSYMICNLTANDSAKLISKQKYEATMNLSDYGLYGESLGLYHETFNINKTDLFTGKTFFINNLCQDKEDAYMMDVDIDRKLPVFELENGFYELEVLEGLDRYHLTSEETINEVFLSTPYKGYQKKVTILANKALFKDKEDQLILNNNIVYIHVEEVKQKSTTTDIVIDPGRLTELWEGFIDYGSNRDNLVEAHEMYEMAELIKHELEAHGLNVEILRDKDEALPYNGKGGRIEKAYQSKAKYFLSLSFPSSNFSHDKGVTVLYSSHSSNNMATTVMKTLLEETSIQASSWTGRNDIQGVYPSSLDDNLDRRLEIRESGGKFTGAGKLGENEFVEDYSNGMHALVIEYGYMSDDHDFNTWKNEKEKIAKATARGILKTLKIIE